MGGKGGVGKTGVIVALAEWFEANEIPVTLLDLDTENKARGSLKHFFNGTVADFTYWKSTEQALRFREAFSPEVLQMEFRLADLENPIRQHGVQLGQVADRKAQVEELKRASLVMRAQSYRRRLFAEFDRAREAFLP